MSVFVFVVPSYLFKCITCLILTYTYLFSSLCKSNSVIFVDSYLSCFVSLCVSLFLILEFSSKECYL